MRGSNSIEGYNVSLDDAVAAAAGDEPIDVEEEAWTAVVSYRDAMTYVLQLADDPHFAYDENLIRSLHYMMLRWDHDKSPGRWRPSPIYVRDDQTQEIVYTGPDADQCAFLMAELVEQLRQSHSALVEAALAHLNLAMIHPFRDGNGRMARCLQTLVLAREGILAPAFASIEEYLGANTDDYYQVLAEVGQGGWHPERNTRPWLRFVLTAHYRQAQTLVRRANEAERRWDAISAEGARLRLPDRALPALFNASMGFRIRNSSYRDLAGVSDTLAGRDLRQLVADGALDAVGAARGRYYQATARLRALGQSVLEARKPLDDPFELVRVEATLGL